MTRSAKPGVVGKRYMGPPCSKGHPGERYATNQQCCECALERNRRHRNYPKARTEYAKRVVRHIRPEQHHGLMSAAADAAKANRVPPLTDFRGDVSGLAIAPAKF